MNIMAWARVKAAIVLGIAVLLAGGAKTTALARGDEGDNTNNTPGVEAFKKYLSSDAPIKLLRFSEIDGATGIQRHYLAAVDGDDFFSAGIQA